MHTKAARRTPAPPVIESLEGREFLSASAVNSETVRAALRAPFTTTVLQASPHRPKIGQAVTVTAIVRAQKRFGTPAGFVEFVDNGNVITNQDGSALMVAVGANGRASYSFGAGNLAFYIGSHTLVAQFMSSNALPSSASRPTTVVVGKPLVRIANDGLEEAVLKRGHGGTIGVGQTATVLYTGFLPATGEIFDYASAHPGGTLSFSIGAGNVIPGFEEGTFGMKVGETRVLAIPSSLGYGANAIGSIPASSDLVFLVTLLSIG